MSYGFESINQDGIVQIDDNFRCHLHSASGTIGAGTTTINFTNQSSCPMIFVKCASGVYTAPYIITTNSVTIFANGTVDYIVYGLDNPTPTASGTYGLQVRDGSGVVTYDSRYRTPRIQTTVMANLPATPAYPYTYSTPVGADWFLLNSMLFIEDENASTICANLYNGVLTIRCGIFMYGQWTWFTNNGSSGTYTTNYPGNKMRIPISK